MDQTVCSVVPTNNSWINADGTASSSNCIMTYCGCNCWPCICYKPYTYSYPVVVTQPNRPIKLTLTEVDKLRAAARKDKELKAVLEKFTDQIEIILDWK